MPIPPCPLPDNPVIPLISPENKIIDAVQPSDPPQSPTADDAGETVLSLNHGYKWYKYENPNYLPTNGRVHAKKWQIRRPSGDTKSWNGNVTREFFPLEYFYFPFQKNKGYQPYV